MFSGARNVLLFTTLACVGQVTATAQTPARTDGHASLPFKMGDNRAIVLYFIASDCPISNRLLPEMLRIERTFSARHVRFYFVYPNPNETPATIATHRAAYSLEPDERVLTDRHETLARLAKANTTPEAAVLIARGKSLIPVYTGRIDDRFVSLGTERPTATHHDLEEALAAVLSDRPVPPPGGPPVGCAFMTLASR